MTTITLLEEGQNLCHTTEAQTEACTESPKSQVILDKPNPYDNQIKKTEIVHAPCEPCAQVEEKMCAINTEPTQTSVMDTTCANMVTEGISLQEYSTASPICTSTTHSESLPSKMEYVEVNVENVEKCRDEAPKDDTTGTLVEHNKESVPDHKSQRSPVLMSHEVVEEKTVCTTPQEQVVVTDAPSGNHDALCHPCNCESGSKNPHGHRFSKNVDSLQEIADNSLYNEELSESRLNIPLESRKVETVSNAHEDSQSQCSTHHVVTNHCPQKEVVEVINPGHETIQVTQEVVQGGNSCPESPCETKTVIAERNDLSEFSTVVPAVRDGHIEWSTQNACTEPSHPREVTVINPYHGTTEGPCATKEVIHVSSPRPKYLSSPLCDQTEWLFKKIISSNIPQRKPAHKPCHQSSFYEEEVHVDNPHHEVVKQPYYTKEVRVQKHPLYFSGYNSKSDSQLSVDYFRHGNAHPKVYVDGYESSSGSGYYSDPVKSVTYRQPFIVDTFKVSNPRIPFIEHVKYVEPDRTVVETYHSPHSTNCYREHVRFHPFSELLESYKYSHPVTPIRHHAKTLEPHIYRIVPKYDIIPRGDIKSLNIPDLVPTNQYLKINVPHRPPVCHRDFAHANKAPVVRNEYYVRKSQPSWRNVSVQKEASLTPGCTKYKGELDEHC